MVGISSTLLWGYSVTEALGVAAEIGCTGMEVWAEHVWLRGDSPAKIRRRAGELGLSLTVHSASWDLNLTARNEGIRQASAGEVVRSIELAAEVGAAMITVHPGRASLHGKDLDWHWERQAEAFRFLAEEGASRGILLNVEMMEPIAREFCTEPADINRLLDAVSHPNLGVTFDFAHVSLTKDPVQELKALRRVDEVHLSDSTAAKLHVPLGKGEIKLGPVIEIIAERGLPVTMEGYEAGRTTELAVWNKQVFDRLWAQYGHSAPASRVE